MKRSIASFFGVVFAVLLTACSDPAPIGLTSEEPAPVLQRSNDQDTFYCGEETTRARAVQFFEDLDTALSSSKGPNKFNRFMAPRFSVVENERYLAFDLVEFNAVTPRFIAPDDWSEIARRGLDGLDHGGYRGCFFDNGRVWLEAYGDQGLLLKGINHDIAWKN